MTQRWGCPNEPPCPHYWHDIYEMGDPYPVCCTEECGCGKPDITPILRKNDETGEVVVVGEAPPVIQVQRALLDSMADQGSQQWDPDTMVLVLDTAGLHRYRYLRPYDVETVVFGRIKSADRVSAPTGERAGPERNEP